MEPIRSKFSWRRWIGAPALITGCLTLNLWSQPAQERPTPYDAVLSRLDTGGDFLLFWNATKALNTLDETLYGLMELIPESEGPESVALVKAAYRALGLSELQAVGMSSRQYEDGFYRNRAVLYHGPEAGEGLIWKVFGEASRELWWARQLPDTTAIALFSDVHWKLIWETVGRLAAESGVAEMEAGIEEALSHLAEILDPEAFAASLDSGIGLAVTLNPEMQVTLPIEETGGTLTVPEPGLLLSIRARGPYISDRIHRALEEAEIPVSASEVEGIVVKSLAFPLPLPFRVTPSLFEADGILYLTSNLEVAERVLKARRDPGEAIGATEAFQTIAGDWDFRASEFAYVAPSAGDIVEQIQELILSQAEMGPDEKAILNLLSKGWGENAIGSGILATLNRESDGFYIEQRSTVSGGPALLAQVGAAQVGVGAAMILPALAKAKESAQRAQCMNNMKQLAIAAFLYSEEQEEPAFPEAFSDMFEFLDTPSVFVCPSDDSVEVAPDWESFDPDKHSSYTLITDLDWDQPLSEQPLITCKVNDLVAYGDGSVRSE